MTALLNCNLCSADVVILPSEHKIMECMHIILRSELQLLKYHHSKTASVMHGLLFGYTKYLWPTAFLRL